MIRLERRSRVPLGHLQRDSRGRWGWVGGDVGLDGFVVRASTDIVWGKADGMEVARLQFVMDRNRLVSKGTCVIPTHRRFGLGRDLWREAIAWKSPRSVLVACVSAAGLRLIRSLEREYPQIKWTVFDDRSTHE